MKNTTKMLKELCQFIEIFWCAFVSTDKNDYNISALTIYKINS